MKEFTPRTGTGVRPNSDGSFRKNVHIAVWMVGDVRFFSAKAAHEFARKAKEKVIGPIS